MRTISVNALALAALALPLTTPASAQGRFIPDVEQIELLCPQIGLNGYLLGAVETSAHWAELAEVETQAPAPLVDASLIFTTWSNRLAAIEWQGPGFEGMEHFPWLDGISEELEAAGWSLHGEEDGLFEPVEYRKEIATADGPRTFAVKAASNGNFELTCGDAALLDLSAAEALGDLAEGSPRPLPPPADWANVADSWLARFDCDDDTLLARLDQVEKLDQTAPVVIAHIGQPPDLGAEGDYQRRLEMWLRWKIRTSGKLSFEESLEIEDRAVSYDSRESAEDVTDFLLTATALIEAQKGGDGKARCTAARSLFAGARESGEREARRIARANAVRIAEARKLGIAID
ncbi:hypothetical protein U4960_12295 [Altererythrobacter sp. H2]|uniref:hypothetical protein n=1 Tax=Altererythrobacter sp. H2 TaxID=3108391 RepID=UPI002B4BC2B8|nr:hypothetical protein [Altererythrobacter sp. H2]WRK95067.1 hypothetical protein U4960_12295 [Altererythrobacter sp. H2]